VSLRVTVVGSLNTDLVVKGPRLPDAGETVLGGTFAVFPGGKGANQAVAAARLGAVVTMVGRVGSDPFGRQLREGLAAEGINVAHVRVTDDAPSGVALITVDPAGRNTIVVAGGANARVTTQDVEAARDAIVASQVLLLQLEVPLDAVVAAAELAWRSGCRVVLDPAPAPDGPLPAGLYQTLSVINPNEIEARSLSGIAVGDEASAAASAEWFLGSGCEVVVIKRGAKGAFLATRAHREVVPGIPVEAVDSSAAGDAFAGAIGVALAEEKTLAEAVRFANMVAALSVTRMGAQPSMPRRDEVEAFAAARGLAFH